MQNYDIFEGDRKDFEVKIAPDIKSGNKITIYCSFTFITPNYAILFTLNELKKFAENKNVHVVLVLWDLNVLANEYYQRMKTLKKIFSAEEYINGRVEELRRVALSVGLEDENLSIYKSSELWKRLISYKEENLFQQFYSVLAQAKMVDRPAYNNDKIIHYFQIPLDMFFANYFHLLYPEDFDREIDLMIFGTNKEKLYLKTRELMVKNGLIDNNNPLLIRLMEYPYLIHNYNVPEWNMKQKEIAEIVAGSKISKPEMLKLFRYFGESGIVVKKDNVSIETDYNPFMKKFKGASREELVSVLSQNLYRFLQFRKEKFDYLNDSPVEGVLSVSQKNEVKKIGSVLKSGIALEILIRADGTRNTSQIAKELNKSVATISTYANRLKKMNLIRILPDGNLKRNIKGVKVNLELGI